MARQKRRRKRRDEEEEAEIPMAPMIDVVFLLLIYFIMTLEPIPIFANLNVFTPSTDAPPKVQPDKPPEVIRIGVYSDGFTFDEISVTERQLDNFLRTLSRASKTQTVLILCATDSKHGSLVRLLNICAKYEMTNLSVVSAN
jgi:biopolymer transport protein ExbD